MDETRACYESPASAELSKRRVSRTARRRKALVKGAVGADLELTKLQQIKMYDCEGSGVGKAAMRGFAFFFSERRN